MPGRLTVKKAEPARTFGRRIVQLRNGRRLTQRQLAELVAARLKKQGQRGFTVTYLSKIESEKMGPPSEAAILAIAEILQVDADELLFLAGRPPFGLAQELTKNLKAREFFRIAMASKLADADWEELSEKVKKKASTK